MKVVYQIEDIWYVLDSLRIGSLLFLLLGILWLRLLISGAEAMLGSPTSHPKIEETESIDAPTEDNTNAD
jgi:hypothetical protein